MRKLVMEEHNILILSEIKSRRLKATNCIGCVVQPMIQKKKKK